MYFEEKQFKTILWQIRMFKTIVKSYLQISRKFQNHCRSAKHLWNNGLTFNLTKKNIKTYQNHFVGFPLFSAKNQNHFVKPQPICGPIQKYVQNHFVELPKVVQTFIFLEKTKPFCKVPGSLNDFFMEISTDHPWTPKNDCRLVLKFSWKSALGTHEHPKSLQIGFKCSWKSAPSPRKSLQFGFDLFGKNWMSTLQNKMQPTNPNAHTYDNGTDSETRR